MYQKFNSIIISILVMLFSIKSSLAEITFQDILENPSDLEMNLKYASEQEALGRYKSTLTTLERLNMLYPVNTDIKLYLISILLKMDSAVKLQLMIETMLQDPNTTKETRDYIEEILQTIREQSKPEAKWFAYADVNYMQTDHSNIDGISKTGNLFASDNIQSFASDSLRYDKTYSRGSSVTFGKNLSANSAISLTAGLSINTQNKGVLNENDVVSTSVSYSKISGKHMSIPYIFYSRPNERSAADVSTRGIGFNNSYSVDKNNSITYSASASSTIYNKVARKETELADDANNDIYTLSVGNNYTFSGVNLISTKFSYLEKDAKADYNAYNGSSFNIGYTRVLPFGTLKLEKTFQRNIYDSRNSFINSTINRKDDIDISKIQLSGKITQLIPFIGKFDPKGLIFYNMNFTEIDSDSTLLNNTAIRQTTSFNIVKRFSLYE